MWLKQHHFVSKQQGPIPVWDCWAEWIQAGQTPAMAMVHMLVLFRSWRRW